MRGSTRRVVHSVNAGLAPIGRAIAPPVGRVATPVAYGGVWLLFKVTGVRS